MQLSGGLGAKRSWEGRGGRLGVLGEGLPEIPYEDPSCLLRAVGWSYVGVYLDFILSPFLGASYAFGVISEGIHAEIGLKQGSDACKQV